MVLERKSETGGRQIEGGVEGWERESETCMIFNTQSTWWLYHGNTGVGESEMICNAQSTMMIISGGVWGLGGGGGKREKQFLTQSWQLYQGKGGDGGWGVGGWRETDTDHRKRETETDHEGICDAETNVGWLYVAWNPSTETSNGWGKHQQAAHVVLQHTALVSVPSRNTSNNA